MLRRTFIQGSAASLAAWPFATARGQGYPPERQKETGATVYLDKSAGSGSLNKQHFNPFESGRQELHELGLPYPDRMSPLYDTWLEVFRPPLEFKNQIVSDTILDYQLNPRFAPSQTPTRWQSSQNWSGAYVEPSNGNMLMEVAANWVIPDLSGVVNPTPLQSSSIWVGLDGQRLYFNSSLPQIGTTQQIDKHGRIDYHAWYQWWERGQGHNRPVPISTANITLEAFDRVFCDIQVVDPTTVIATIAKLGPTPQVWCHAIHPKKLAHGTGTPQVSGATAQWVVERPTDPSSDNLLQLINYGEVGFTNCWALAGAAPDASLADVQQLETARFIRMYDRLQGPPRTTWLSTPRRLVPDRQDAFTVSYTGP